MTEDADGDTEISAIEAMLIPVNATTLSATDSDSFSYSYPDGEMINEQVYASENGNTLIDAQLRPNEEGWTVQGIAQGKEIDVTIETSETLYSLLGQLKKTQEIVQSGDTGSVEFHIWLPSVDPVALTTALVDVKEDKKGTVSTGPLVLQAEFDDHGDTARANMDMGGLNMQIYKVWEQGSH